jgi:hypothetical protein
MNIYRDGFKVEQKMMMVKEEEENVRQRAFSCSGLYFGYPIAFHTKLLVGLFHSVLVRCIYNAKGFVLFFVVKDILVRNAEFILWRVLDLF